MPINCEGKYGYLFMQELKLPESREKMQASYKLFGERVHWVDGNFIPGAFQMNTCWWYKENRERTLANPNGGAAKTHFHEFPEILGFYGSDPYHPWDLGGEVEFWVDGEQHILTKSTMVFLPPNLPHCPLIINRVDRPIFHFSVVMNAVYDLRNDEGGERAE